MSLNTRITDLNEVPLNIQVQGPPQIGWTERYDYDASGNVSYYGCALSANNPLTSQAVWFIKKFTVNGSNQTTLIQLANGSPAANNIWDNRATTVTYQ